ncbi:MAG: PAS domain S-box protein [Acidobacteria bacterium]|nr:PAS domain S-box protein [Acidobacteriota bacterium]
MTDANAASAGRGVQLAGGLAIVVGGLVSVGWVLDIAPLSSMLPGQVSMKPNTAVAFVLVGIALLFASRSMSTLDPRLSTLFSRLGGLCALVAGLIGLFTLAEYASGWNPGLDQWFGQEPVASVGTSHPGRMAPDTALCFVLLAAASWLLGRPRPSRWNLITTGTFGTLVATIPLAAMLSYLTPMLGAYGWWGYTVMAIPTAVLLVVLGLAVASMAWRPGVVGWSLGGKTTATFAAGLALMAFIGLNLSRGLVRTAEIEGRVAHTEQVQLGLARFRSNVVQAQSSTRGYIITGEERFATSYLAAANRCHEEMTALRGLTADNPSQQGRLARLEPQVTDALQWWQQTLETRRTNADSSAQRVESGTGQRLMDTVTLTLEQLESEERQLLQRREREAVGVIRLSQAVVSSGTIASLAMFLGALWSVNRASIERKRGEEALRASEARYRSYTDVTGQIGWVTNADGAVVEDVPSLRRFTGQTYEETRGSGWAKALHPDDLARTVRVWNEAVATRSSYEVEYRLRRHDGVYRHFLARSFPVVRADGSVQEWVGTCIDITERQQADEALRESAQQFRILFDQATDGMMLADAETTRITLSNRQMQRQMGYSEDEILQLSVRDLHTAADLPTMLTQFETLARGAVSLVPNAPMRRKDGTVFYADIGGGVVRFRQRDCLLGIFRDVTERKRADEALRASEERFRIAAETANDVLYEWDLKQSVQWLGHVDEMLGYEPGEFPRTLDGWAQSVHPDDIERTMAEVQAHVDKRTPYVTEYRVRRKDGVYRWWSARGAAARTPDGEPLRMIGSITDITERKSAENELRETSEFLENLFDHANAPIIVWSPEFRITRFNHAFESLTGRRAEDVIGGPLDILFPPDRVADAMALISGTTGGERWETVDIPIRRLDGAVRTVIWNSATIFGEDGTTPVATIAQGQDITERKSAENELRKRTDMLARTGQIAHLGSWEWDVAKDSVIWSDELFRIFGLAPGGRAPSLAACSKYYNPDDLRRLEAAIAETITNGTPFEMEIAMTRQDGEKRICLARGHLISALGSSPQLGGSFHDITDHKRLELAVRTSEEQFRTMANAMPQLAWIAKADGFIFWYNQRWYEYTNTTPEQMEGWGWQSVHDPDVLPQVMHNWTGSIASGKPFEMQFPLRGADGRFRTFLTRVQPIRDASGQVVQWFGTNTDVEPMKQVEEEVRTLNAELEQRVRGRTAQLEASNKDLEAFSYSVSHDLRAPLRAIDGFGRILKEDYESHLDAEGQRLLGVISSETQRMGHLIDDLLVFSRLGRQNMEALDIDMTDMAQAVFDEQAAQAPERALQLELKPLPPTQGDRAMLRVVLGNLLSNAIKFTRPRNPAVIEIGSRREDEQDVYYVKDNGVGFDMRYAHKLFGVFQRLHSSDEFEGTGVGLALAQRVVQRHGGRIWAEANVNEGAVFSFSLPNMKEQQ